jgi:hypothetical protein
LRGKLSLKGALKMRVADLDKDLRFVSEPEDVRQINGVIGARCDKCRALYVKARNGGYALVYGVPTTAPIGSDQVHPHKEPVGVLL